MIRAIIIAATIATLICLWLDRPTPPRMVETPYCPVDVRAAARDELGQWHSAWIKLYRPCTELDRYETA